MHELFTQKLKIHFPNNQKRLKMENLERKRRSTFRRLRERTGDEEEHDKQEKADFHGIGNWTTIRKKMRGF